MSCAATYGNDPDVDGHAWRRAFRLNPAAALGFAFGVVAFFFFFVAVIDVALGFTVDGPASGSVSDTLPVVIALPLLVVGFLGGVCWMTILR